MVTLPAVPGCPTCATTAGPIACPVHHPAGVAEAIALGHAHHWRTDLTEGPDAIQTCSTPGCGAVRRQSIDNGGIRLG